MASAPNSSSAAPASAFAITTTAGTVPLDPTRRTGAASFTVSNLTGRALRARARVVATAPAADWLTLDGDAERAYPVNGTQQYGVRIAAPPTASSGSYLFRLDVAGVDNPDEEYARGPSVGFVVPEPPVIHDESTGQSKGYVETLIGAFVGGIVGGMLLGGLGLVLALVLARSSSGPPSGASPGEIIASIIGGSIVAAIILVVAVAGLALVGMWIGEVVGAGLALRLSHLPGDLPTALALAAIAPIWGAVMLFLQSAIGRGNGLVLAVALLLILVVPPLAARAIVVWRLTGKP
jgi:hypothetical protein